MRNQEGLKSLEQEEEVEKLLQSPQAKAHGSNPWDEPSKFRREHRSVDRLD